MKYFDRYFYYYIVYLILVLIVYLNKRISTTWFLIFTIFTITWLIARIFVFKGGFMFRKSRIKRLKAKKKTLERALITCYLSDEAKVNAFDKINKIELKIRKLEK